MHLRGMLKNTKSGVCRERRVPYALDGAFSQVSSDITFEDVVGARRFFTDRRRVFLRVGLRIREH